MKLSEEIRSSKFSTERQAFFTSIIIIDALTAIFFSKLGDLKTGGKLLYVDEEIIFTVWMKKIPLLGWMMKYCKSVTKRKTYVVVHEISLFSCVSKLMQRISNYSVLRYIKCLGNNFKLLGLISSYWTLYVCLSRNATQHDPRNRKFSKSSWWYGNILFFTRAQLE